MLRQNQITKTAVQVNNRIVQNMSQAKISVCP